MKLAIAQINCTVGDLSGNASKILDCANRARAMGAGLVITPELALSGSPPQDLLLRPGFRLACNNALAELVQSISGVSLLVGYPHLANGQLFNAASVISEGKIIATYFKTRLFDNGVTDERRYFEPGFDPCLFELDGIKFAISIGRDISRPGTAARAKAAGADVLLVLNASPYHIRKQFLRQRVVRARTRDTGIPVVYANLVGAQDELVFDGASFAMNKLGELTHQMDGFKETLGLIEFQKDAMPVPGNFLPVQSVEASVYQALCLGVKDYVGKNRIPGVLLGLSGGVDSALTLAIAVDALGPDNVEAVMMPSRFTADISIADARKLAKTLNVRYSELSIGPVFDRYIATLATKFAEYPSQAYPGAAEENLQARIRGNLLMALSNKNGSIVLSTGNKSEIAVGYCTLYGDMAGGLAVLKDISKTMVYRLCHYRNTLGYVIPERVISRPPSAELRPDQADSDSLPPYEVLDTIVEAYIEHDLPVDEILGMGFSESDVRRVIKLIHLSEHKRRQSPPGIRVTKRSFGRDWRYPITVRHREDF